MKLALAVVVGLFAGSAACSNSANPEEGECPTSCVAGTPVDACTVRTGVCNAATATCETEPVPAGTSCGGGMICDSDAMCVGESFVGINEVESSGGTPGDWVELFNAGTDPADIGGWIFRDNDDTHTYTIPAGTTIGAGGYLVLEEADLGFGLGTADSARLFTGTTLVDSYEWTEHATTSYGRCPDMTGELGTSTTVTKGAANDCGPAAAKIGINEVESDAGTPGDWVELYNAGTAAVDIGGWIFRDSDDTHTYAIPAGTMIAAGGYVVLDEADFGFGLGGADSARLFNGTTLVDSYAWTAHATTSYGRCPDMTGAFATTTTVTKGMANNCAAAVGINEVESDAGTPGDWVELYNAGAAAVDVGGWIFRDSDDTHTYAIPAGTMIGAGGYLVLEEADFGFGLGGADSARLFDGTTLVDSYAWTVHAATTYGRCPDMTGAFAATTASTKGAANTCP